MAAFEKAGTLGKLCRSLSFLKSFLVEISEEVVRSTLIYEQLPKIQQSQQKLLLN